MAGQSAAILVNKNECLLQLFFLKYYMLMSILTTYKDHTGHCGNWGGYQGKYGQIQANTGKHLHFGGLTFGTEIKSMENTRNKKLSFRVNL